MIWIACVLLVLYALEKAGPCLFWALYFASLERRALGDVIDVEARWVDEVPLLKNK
jgi:hypothetical protein